MFWNKGDSKIRTSSMLSITEDGKALLKQELVKGVSFVLLSKLEEHSPRSIVDMANETGIDSHEMQERAEILAKQGLLAIRN